MNINEHFEQLHRCNYHYRWAPAEEQSKFVTFTYIGNTFGTMITYPISGVILNSIGWEVSK